MTGRSIVVDIPAPEAEPLAAPLDPAFDYTRSTGPVLGAFFTALRGGRILGVRDSAGQVHVPPVEFDPHTHEALGELVEVGRSGVVDSWTWVAEPTERMPLHSPHALALVRLDGADTAWPQLVAADGPEVMRTGMRVTATWVERPTGSVRDVHFVPEEAVTGAATRVHHPADVPEGPDAEEPGDVTRLVTPVSLAYTHTSGGAEARWLRGLVEGRIEGRRRANGPEVYVPPRDYCPSDGAPMGEFVEVSDTGTVTTFGIVNVPLAGQRITPPYVTAYILLDGADLPIQHLVLDCDAADVRMGMRVRAVWRPEGERPYSLQAISHFAPTGDPDADRSTYERHL